MIYPIVGAHYHRPAKAILAVLPIGAELELIPEPDNPYDPNAIAIWVHGRQIPVSSASELQSLSLGYGFSANEIICDDMWMLGYIPREIAAKLSPFKMTKGQFAVGSDGGPRVTLELKPNEAS